jgi:hypothetical protein
MAAVIMTTLTTATGTPIVTPRGVGLEAGWGVVDACRDWLGVVVAVVVTGLTAVTEVERLADVGEATESVEVA